MRRHEHVGGVEGTWVDVQLARDPSLQQLGQISSGHRHGGCGGVNVTVKSMTGLSLSVHADEHVTVLALKKYVAHQESGEHSHTLLFLVRANTPHPVVL